MAIVDVHNLIKDEPVLIAANHPASFMEPSCMGIFLPFTPYYMTRGDVFKGPYKWFLINTNQIPIFRFRDGMEGLRKNQDSFKWAYRIISECRPLIVFCEGTTKLVKRVRKVQKGIAKMLIGAKEDYPDMYINVQPIGVNFHELERFRSTAIIKVGKVIPQPRFDEKDQVEDIDKFTLDVACGLKKQVVHIDDEDDDKWIDVFLKIIHDESLKRKVRWTAMFDKFQTTICYLEKNKHLKEKALEYIALCQKHSLVVGPGYKWPGIASIVFHLISLVLSLPCALIFGTIYRVCDRYTKKKFKQVEFRIPVRLGMLVGISTIVSLILLIGLLYFSWILTIQVIILMVASTFALIWVVDFYNLYRNVYNIERLKKEDKEFIKKSYDEILGYVK